MNKSEQKLCADCHSEMSRSLVEQEFEREGVRVVVSGIPALKCPNCGAVSYAPGTMDHVTRSARELFEIARDGHSNLMAVRATTAH